MHPHCGYSHAHPMDDVDNSQWKFHSPDTEHRPAKSFHFLDQTLHCVEHWQQKDTQVDDRQLEHHFYPSNRHKPFPRNHCNRSPLCPLQAYFLQSVSKFLVYKLEVNSYLGLQNKRSEKTNSSIPPFVILSCTQNILKWKTLSFCVNLHRTSVIIFDLSVQSNRGIPWNVAKLGYRDLHFERATIKRPV